MADPVAAAKGAATGALSTAWHLTLKLAVPAAIVFTGLTLIAGPTAAFAAATTGGETVASAIKTGYTSLTAALG
jgi:hypothetical protein